MRFPFVHEIATKEVESVTYETTIEEAMQKMLQTRHRSIVVTHGSDYHILTATDIIQIRLNNVDFSTVLGDIPLRVLPQLHREANILDALEFIQNGYEFLCVINDERNLCGIVTHIDPDTLMQNYQLRDLLNAMPIAKTSSPDTPMVDVLQKIDTTQSDSIIVTEKGVPVGIVTTKDTTKILLEHPDLTLPVKEFMIQPVDVLYENITIKKALLYIQEKDYNRVVVVNTNKELIGIVLQRDLIAYSYSNWISLVKNHHNELIELNKILKHKTEKLEHLAATDPLTKLYNRRMFIELYEASIEEDPDTFYALALIDIDNFKTVNDTLGHNEGDKVIAEIARYLNEHTRSSDIVARWGGEEFIILLTQTPLQKALHKAQVLCNEIAKITLSNDKNVTVSIGLSELDTQLSLGKNIHKADALLYQAKKEGKNRVKI